MLCWLGMEYQQLGNVMQNVLAHNNFYLLSSSNYNG